MNIVQPKRPAPRLIAYYPPCDINKEYALPHPTGTGGWLNWAVDQGRNPVFSAAMVDNPLGKWPAGNEWRLRFDQLLALRRNLVSFNTDLLTDGLLRLKTLYPDTFAYVGSLTGNQRGPSWETGDQPVPDIRNLEWRQRCMQPLIDGRISSIILDATGNMVVGSPESFLLYLGNISMGVEHMPGRYTTGMANRPSLTIIGERTEADHLEDEPPRDLLRINASQPISIHYMPLGNIFGEVTMIQNGPNFHDALNRGDLSVLRMTAKAFVQFGCSVAFAYDIPLTQEMWDQACNEWRI